MVVVDNFEERLDAATSGTLLLAHSSCHWSGISVDASHQSMSVTFGVGSIVLVVDDHCFATSVLASQQQDNLAGFHNLAHLENVRDHVPNGNKYTEMPRITKS